MIKKNKIIPSSNIRTSLKRKVWKRLLFYSTTILFIFSFTSCGYESPKYKMISAQRDSIIMVQRTLQRDVDEYLHASNHINENIDKIKAKETGYIPLINTKLNDKGNAMVNENIAKINALIRSTRDESVALKNQIKRSVFKAKELERNIESLNLMLQQETAKSAVLKNEIEAKDSILETLDKKVHDLTLELMFVNNEISQQAELIAQYKDELFTGYYIAGSKSELKNKNILTKEGFCKTALFQENVDKNIFSKINILETTVIPLPPSVKGKLLSSHPESSYKFTGLGDKKFIEILNPEKFWSITKYLVIL